MITRLQPYRCWDFVCVITVPGLERIVLELLLLLVSFISFWDTSHVLFLKTGFFWVKALTAGSSASWGLVLRACTTMPRSSLMVLNIIKWKENSSKYIHADVSNIKCFSTMTLKQYMATWVQTSWLGQGDYLMLTGNSYFFWNFLWLWVMILFWSLILLLHFQLFPPRFSTSGLCSNNGKARRRWEWQFCSIGISFLYRAIPVSLVTRTVHFVITVPKKQPKVSQYSWKENIMAYYPFTLLKH